MEDNRQEPKLSFRYNTTLANAGPAAIREAVANMLAGEHVPTILYGYYGTFALQVAKVVRTCGGGRVPFEELKAQMHLWQVRGLDMRLLLRLACDLFDIPRELLDSPESEEGR